MSGSQKFLNAFRFWNRIHGSLRCNLSTEVGATESELGPKPSAFRGPKWLQYENRPLDLNPESTSILLFPGQGSQFVGMGKNLVHIPRVRQLFESANEMLRTDLLKTCLEGPLTKLNQTIHSQPAVYVVSLAAVSKLLEEKPDVRWLNFVNETLHSLGELTALVFSGAFTFEQGLHLVRVRAQAMQQACQRVKGAMCSVFLDHNSQLKLAVLAAKNHCEAKLGLKEAHCSVVNYLYAECKVLAGHVSAIEFIERNAPQFGIRRVKRLPVSGAFHTPLMKSAIKPFSSALSRIGEISTPAIPVLSAVDLQPYRSAENIKRKLVSQLVRPVLWEQTLQALYERPPDALFPATFEVGPGRQLGAMLRMVNRKAYGAYKALEV